MGLFGTTAARLGMGLMDTRTEEERRRELEAMIPQLGNAGGGKWGAIGDKIGGLASGLGAAQAYWDGDFGTAAQITGQQQNRAAAASKQAAEAAQQRQIMAALQAQGLSPEQAMVVAGNAGTIGDFRQKPVEPPAFVKNREAWIKMSPTEQQQVRDVEGALHPSYFRGEDGRPYQNQPAQPTTPPPWHDNPDDWEMVPGPQGGGAGNGAGGFPSNIPRGNPLDPNLRRHRR